MFNMAPVSNKSRTKNGLNNASFFFKITWKGLPRPKRPGNFQAVICLQMSTPWTLNTQLNISSIGKVLTLSQMQWLLFGKVE